jgi:hypothetical protein
MYTRRMQFFYEILVTNIYQVQVLKLTLEASPPAQRRQVYQTCQAGHYWSI